MSATGKHTADWKHQEASWPVALVAIVLFISSVAVWSAIARGA